MRRYLLSICGAAALAASLGCEYEPGIIPGAAIPVAEPYVTIYLPKPVSGIPDYSGVVRFAWSSSGINRARYTRYFFTPSVDSTGKYDPTFDLAADLTENPSRYDTLWSEWRPVSAPGDSGVSTIIGDDEEPAYNLYYYFAVQARDADFNLTETFSRQTNVRFFKIIYTSGPFLRIIEPALAYFSFVGTNLNPETRKVPPGAKLEFRWRADASSYGGEIAGYRFGWDIVDPDAWDAPFVPGNRSCPVTSFYSGTHTLYIEAVDLGGLLVRGRIVIEIVPWPLGRNLLWVDDFYSTDYPIPDYSYPTESAYDNFWTNICSRASGFDPGTDIFDCSQHYYPPSISDLSNYRNVIWTFADGNYCKWKSIVHFVPESALRDGSTDKTVNIISLYLRAGGHIWTLGRSDYGGGLAATLSPSAQEFPMSLECEITGNDPTCSGDRSGVESMPYRDYCISMIDKVSGVLRNDDYMPHRKLDHYDVMISALRDDSDPVTASHPGLPPRLDLWDEVTAPGRYFCTDSTCSPGGFTYVEAYDPSYWMNRMAASSGLCFHPIYRMVAASEYSVLNGAAVSVWITNYEDVVPQGTSGGGVAAPSVHFGFPLWFFRHQSADSIADVVFEEWGIK